MATTIAVLNKGVFEQIGTPQAVYDFPSSLFTALSVVVCGFENLGGKIIFSVTCGQIRMRALVPLHVHAKAKEPLMLYIDIRRVHLF